MSTPPGNPYGQQPQSPYGQNPYGQNPYGAQQPQGPYGQPPAAGGQPPYGAYGQQPPGPYPPQPHGWGAPPPKKRRGLVIGIVGGVVALIVVVVAALALVGSKGGGFPEAKNKLVLSKTLLNGRYTLSQDLSDSEGKKIEDEADGSWEAKDTHAVVGQYSLGGDQTKGTLVVSGMYGRFKHPDKARGNMMKGAGEGQAKVVVPPKDFHPDSSGITVTCEVLTQVQMGTTLTVPMCGWVDDNTGASIAEITAETMTQDPLQVDLEAAAKTALQVRTELLKPV
ncbi:hypothetical protein [Streptomyces sp. NPDC014006]|uniref:hypothetical protein n=1 Tax=Streptomyces sp. NPDC014006 TaxID=3364870 RepID=UPI0036F7CE39